MGGEWGKGERRGRAYQKEGMGAEGERKEEAELRWSRKGREMLRRDRSMCKDTRGGGTGGGGITFQDCSLKSIPNNSREFEPSEWLAER